ncbi:hypothetical protein [Hydrogenivirga sp. 128-5-R1-1]|uniref:hypothetical protein n=1 Tax=Hydrogenivirga sp. 128-5-R1-1 TaxID=392423 RepID=UPI00015EF724|nr:hypothetical protein [Hydrogenivirga sp. 128-5-R1-1]EDP75617.1 hypothetical protein HG1285_16675 [Hydrogenivirga sp. 128-5-R1-1]
MSPFEVFLDIVLRFSDLKWSEFRDDLVVKCMKALRKFRDGRSVEEVLSDRKLSSEIEGILEYLHSFAEENDREDVNRVIDALGMFTKAPAPCKMKIIALVETLTGRGKAKG